jgi:FMN reductase
MLLVGIGGSYRPESFSLKALEQLMPYCREVGFETVVLDVRSLDLPAYGSPQAVLRRDAIFKTLDPIRRADAVIVSTPVYASSISSGVKNILDYVHDLPGERPRLEGRVAGVIAVAKDSQTITPLNQLAVACIGLGGIVSKRRLGLHWHNFEADGTINDSIVLRLFFELADDLSQLVGSFGTAATMQEESLVSPAVALPAR